MAWCVRYSTYSTYSKDPGETRAAGASQPLAKKSVLQSSPHGRTGIFFLGKIPTLARARRAPMPGRWRGRGGFYAGQAARNFVAILRQQESTMEQF